MQFKLINIKIMITMFDILNLTRPTTSSSEITGQIGGILALNSDRISADMVHKGAFIRYSHGKHHNHRFVTELGVSIWHAF